MRQVLRLNIKKFLVYPVIIASLMVAFLPINPARVSAAACTAPATDFGTVTSTVSVPSTGAYRVWSRIQIPSSANNSFLLQIDAASCFVVGGNSAVPVNTWIWVDYQSGNTSNKINTTLSAGNHIIKMIGTSEGFLLDRIIMTQDTTAGSSCNPPIGTGDNCANPPNVPPTIGLSASPTSGNAPLTTTLTATPADSDGTVASVEFFKNGVSLGAPKTSAPWTLAQTGLVAGSYNFTAKVTDNDGAVKTSNTVIVAATATSLTPGDTGNTLGKVDLDDLLAVINNWNKSGQTRLNGELDNSDGQNKVNLDDLLQVLNNWTP